MTSDESTGGSGPLDFDRLYTPWRMNYVRGERLDPGCVFCSMRDSADDSAHLILTRGEHCYVVMNLFPYSTGHLLIVPNEHAASPEDLPVAALHELAEQLPRALAAVRTALSPDAFNVGYNLSTDAGAGIAGHLHQHLVPRWRGDANFMSVIGGTKVLPELLPVTFAKLRAEFLRTDIDVFDVVVTDRVRNRVLVEPDSLKLPQLRTKSSRPVWQSALDLAAAAGAHARLTGVERGPDGYLLMLDADSIDPESDASCWRPIADSGVELPPVFTPFG